MRAGIALPRVIVVVGVMIAVPFKRVLAWFIYLYMMMKKREMHMLSTGKHSLYTYRVIRSNELSYYEIVDMYSLQLHL